MKNRASIYREIISTGHNAHKGISVTQRYLLVLLQYSGSIVTPRIDAYFNRSSSSSHGHSNNNREWEEMKDRQRWSSSSRKDEGESG